MDKNIVVSAKTILIAFLMGGMFFLILRLGGIIGLVFISLLITISLEHTVRFFQRQTFLNRPVSRSMAVMISYLFVFISATLTISIGLDPVISQSQKLLQMLGREQQVVKIGEGYDFSPAEVLSGFISTSGGIISATRSVFNNVTGLFSILILSIYMSIDWVNMKIRLAGLFKDKNKQKVEKVLVDIEDNVGLWLRGQLILMLFIGLLSYLGLLAIGVEFPLALGIISGVLEIVPIIGPVVSAVLAALVAVVDSPVKALAVILVFTVIQQIEGNILVPKVMQKVSGFSPIVILIALLIGSNLFGLVGAIVAVPVLMVGSIIVKSLFFDE